MTDHLDEVVWEKLALRELDAAARSAALAHVTSCPRCTKIYKGLLAVERGARTFDPGVSGATVRQTKAPTRRRWIAAIAAAAAIVLVVLWWRRSNDERVLRGAKETIELLEPTGPVSVPVRFSWKPVAAAEHYRLELFTEGGELVWSAVVVHGPYVVPGDLDLSKARFARVTALANVQNIASSRLVSITIR